MSLGESELGPVRGPVALRKCLLGAPAKTSPNEMKLTIRRQDTVQYCHEFSTGKSRAKQFCGFNYMIRRGLSTGVSSLVDLTGHQSQSAILSITDCNMTLGEKLRYLREVEGVLRGFGREMTQQEVVHAIKRDLKQGISQSYLSQIESGARPHLTESTRMLLADFFKVHPGYLVSDPAGYHTELQSAVRLAEDTLDLWLVSGAERFVSDPELTDALVRLARNDDSRKCLILLGAIIDVPGLADRLSAVLHPAGAEAGGSEQ